VLDVVSSGGVGEVFSSLPPTGSGTASVDWSEDVVVSGGVVPESEVPVSPFVVSVPTVSLPPEVCVSEGERGAP